MVTSTFKGHDLYCPNSFSKHYLNLYSPSFSKGFAWPPGLHVSLGDCTPKTIG